MQAPLLDNASPTDPASDAGLIAAGRRRFVVMLAVVTAYVAHAMFACNGAVVDDAYIAFRYSKNLAAGAGLSFQPGPPVEGYSCFSWVLLGAAMEFVGLPSAAFLPIFGIACGAATIVVVMRSFQRTSAATGPLVAVVPGLFLALLPGHAYYAGSGLETGLYSLLVVLSVTSALERRPGLAAIASSLAILTRPEGIAVAVMSLALGSARATAAQRRGWLLAVGATLATVFVYAGFKFWYFGGIVPNTAFAKPPVLAEGLSYVAWGLIDSSALVVLSLVLAIRGRVRAFHRLWALAFAGGLVTVAAAEGGDWMAAGRFLVPALCVAALSFDAIPQAISELRGRLRWAVLALSSGASVFYAYYSWKDTSLLHESASGIEHYEPFRDDLVQRMSKAGVTSVGTLDIGRVSYSAPALRILDLGGLTDREIARSPGDYRSKKLAAELLERKAPDAFLFTSREPPRPRLNEPPSIELYYPVEGDIAASAWFLSRYRLRALLPVRGDYFLCWYERIAAN